ncbi:MAG: carbon-nitrogen hydrolase family protein [Ahrensia sp.]
MRVAALQMRSTTDVEANIKAFEALVRDAAAQGASYIQTPEMTGIVEKNRKALSAAICTQNDDPLFAHASALAAELGVHIHIGSTAIKLDNGMVANRAAVFASDGSLSAIYDKIHMFDVDLDKGESWRESAIYAPGDTLGMVEVGDTKIGLAICYDVRFPPLFRDQALAGAHILTVPAAFTRQTGQAHWHVLLRARAIENGAFVIAAAQGGRHEDGRETYGHSLIIDPWGRIISEKADDEPGVIFADIDLAEVAAARGKVPNLKNARPYNKKNHD